VTSAGDRRNHEYFVAILKAVLLVAKKTDVFLVDIEVDEPTNLPVFAAQVRPQRRESALDLLDQLRQVGGGAGNLAHVVGVLLKRIRQQDFDRHVLPFGQAERLVGGVFFHKVFEVGKPGTDGLALIVGAVKHIGGLKAIAGDANDGGFVRLDAAVRI